MTRVRATLTVALFSLALAVAVDAQTESGLEVFSGNLSYKGDSDVLHLTNDVVVQWNGAVLTAGQASINQRTGEATADGRVRIQREDQIWTGQHIEYNFKTHQLVAARFRTGRAPVFAEGQGLGGDISTNRVSLATNAVAGVYTATNAFVTMDDIANPLIRDDAGTRRGGRDLRLFSSAESVAHQPNDRPAQRMSGCAPWCWVEFFGFRRACFCYGLDDAGQVEK